MKKKVFRERYNPKPEIEVIIKRDNPAYENVTTTIVTKEEIEEKPKKRGRKKSVK